MTAMAATVGDRADRARAVLARAEARTGTSRRHRPVASPTEKDRTVPDRTVPVDARVAHLLPTRALERGSTVAVVGSTSLVLGLLVEASRAGGWVAVVGLPAVGVLAAHQLGLDLDRLVLVPDPGPDGPLAVAALLDGVDVVVVGPQVALSDADRRRLSSRARERASVLLATTGWPGASVVLTAESSRWEGLGQGDGRLRSRLLSVRRGGRGAAAQAWQGEVVLPVGTRPPVLHPGPPVARVTDQGRRAG